MDCYHWTPAQIGQMTDRQIIQLAFHERTKEGKIEEVMPPAKIKDPQTCEEELNFLNLLAGSFKMAPEVVEKQRLKIIAKWEKKKQEANGQ